MHDVCWHQWQTGFFATLTQINFKKMRSESLDTVELQLRCWISGCQEPQQLKSQLSRLSRLILQHSESSTGNELRHTASRPECCSCETLKCMFDIISKLMLMLMHKTCSQKLSPATVRAESGGTVCRGAYAEAQHTSLPNLHPTAE